MRIESGRAARARARSILPALVLGIASALGAVSDAPPQSQELEGEAAALAVSMLWTISDEYFHAGEYQQTIDVDLMVAVLEPTDTDAYANSAWLYESTDREEKALELLRLGVERSPLRFESHHELGMWYYNHGEYDKAAAEFERARRLPCPAYVLHMLAHAYEKQGKLSECIAAWECALRRDPNDAPAKTNLERVKKALSESG
jgi:tetratricopeptide (TPR) repeat protein